MEERKGNGKRGKLPAHRSQQFGNDLEWFAINLLYLVNRLIEEEINRLPREVAVLCFCAHYPAPATGGVL